MEIVGILFLLGLGRAIGKMWDSTVRDFQQSKAKRIKEAEGKAAPNPLPKSRRKAAARRHAAGYWAGEIGHGFPVARTGFHAGWLAHRTATDHHKAIREEAKTTQMETRVGFHGAVKEHRKRQAEAQKAIDEAVAAAPKPVRGKKAVKEAAKDAVILPFPRKAADPPLPADSALPGPSRRIDGDPETEADKRTRAEVWRLRRGAEFANLNGGKAGAADLESRACDLEATLQNPSPVERARMDAWPRARAANLWLEGKGPRPAWLDEPQQATDQPVRDHNAEGDGMEKSDQELLARAHPADLLILAKRELDRGHLERSKELTEWAKAKRQATADGLPGIPYTSSPATNGEAPVADDDHQGGSQSERDMRATAAEHGYEVIKGGEGYQPPEWAMEEARRSATPDPGPNEGNGNGTSPRATSFTANGAAPVATAEITFDQSIAEAGKLIAEQEHKLATLRASRMSNIVEGLAGAVTDSGSLGRAMEMDESLRAEVAACQHTLDSTLAFRGGLIRDHGGLNEAHQSAPVEAADKTFYAG